MVDKWIDSRYVNRQHKMHIVQMLIFSTRYFSTFYTFHCATYQPSHLKRSYMHILKYLKKLFSYIYYLNNRNSRISNKVNVLYRRRLLSHARASSEPINSSRGELRPTSSIWQENSGTYTQQVQPLQSHMVIPHLQSPYLNFSLTQLPATMSTDANLWLRASVAMSEIKHN